MPPEEKPSITLLLGRIQDGDEIARQEVFDLAYAELRGLARGLMRNERPEHTLQPTALVNEAAARILHGESLEGMKCREYFFAAMARAMRKFSFPMQERGTGLNAAESINAFRSTTRLTTLSKSTNSI